jgi:hypothetical protein
MIALRQRSPLEWSAHLRAVMYHDARYPEVERVVSDTTAALGRVLARMVFQLELRDVLAFGAGESLLTVVEALGGLGGGHLTVIEDDPSWDVDQWALVTAKRGVDARLIGSPLFFRLAFGMPHHAYGAGAAAAVAERAPYSLVLVDAPHGYIARDGALHLAMPHLAHGALIVVRKESDTVDRWLDSYPGLVMLHIDRALGDGLAIMGYTGNPTRRVTPRGMLTGAVREAYAWIARRTNGTSESESVHVSDDFEQRNETGLSAHRGG